MNDPVERFLTTEFGGPAPSELRHAVLAQTTMLLRRRRRGRRLAWIGALAACFLAGMATMTAWHALQPPDQQTLNLQAKNLPAQREAPPPIDTEPAPSLVDLEWRAFDSRDNRAALFFEVAQRYFEEQKDYDAALRCYRQAFDAAPKADLAIRPDDNWLVMALKEARQKENNDAILNP